MVGRELVTPGPTVQTFQKPVFTEESPMLVCLQFNYNTRTWSADPWQSTEDWKYAMAYIKYCPTDWDTRLIAVGY